ncbi:hypothetical protein G9A89_017961 [Geosiphon pyriformis]|nr:hypothetical protein G9A89_017961 [Geosiphon pyriformis]
MGQDQPLAVLLNVVSSGKLLSILKAKQLSLIGSLVLKNWADQIETKSSPPLVSGAAAGSAWETIASHQRFVGWVASTLVSDATFKIKLAYVKTVFQSIHGFLGAKLVLKDNVKLFCVEFASQVSLEAAFLVELTSSVHLATLKIAKFLVISEFDSSSAIVVLHNVLLGVSATNIKTALSVFDSITHVVLKSAGIWQYVVVYFEKLDFAVSVLNYWSVLTILSYNRFKAKLVNLLSGCTVFEISNMVSQVGSQTCFILWFFKSGHCFQFALITFGFQANLNSAVVKTGTLKKCHIWWKTSGSDCKISPPFPLKPSKMFTLHFVGPKSYAKTSAFLSFSRFLLLLSPAFFLVVVSDFLLSALVESIVKPIDSLIATFKQFINGNLVSSSVFGLRINKVLVHMSSFSRTVNKLGREVISLKKEYYIEDIDMSGDLEHLIGVNNDTFFNLISLWTYEPVHIKTDFLKTAEWLVGLVLNNVTLFSIVQKMSSLDKFSSKTLI